MHRILSRKSSVVCFPGKWAPSHLPSPREANWLAFCAWIGGTLLLWWIHWGPGSGPQLCSLRNSILAESLRWSDPGLLTHTNSEETDLYPESQLINLQWETFGLICPLFCVEAASCEGKDIISFTHWARNLDKGSWTIQVFNDISLLSSSAIFSTRSYPPHGLDGSGTLAGNPIPESCLHEPVCQMCPFPHIPFAHQPSSNLHVVLYTC